MKIKSKVIIFGLVLFGIISLIGIAIFNKVKHKDVVKKNTSTLDSIQYLSINGTLSTVVPSSKFKIIFFFNSECEHCQNEAKLISKNASVFPGADVFFFSVEELSLIKQFAYTYALTKKNNFEIGKVDYKAVVLKMGVNTNPMCFIYSREGKLLRRYTGEVSVEALLKYLR